MDEAKDYEVFIMPDGGLLFVFVDAEYEEVIEDGEEVRV